MSNVAAKPRFSASPNAIETTRFECIEGTLQRKEREKLFENNARIIEFLNKEVKHWETCDAFTLAYASANAINPAALYLHERHGGEMFNVYAMPKLRLLMRVLNGGAFLGSNDKQGDVMTTCGSILALQAAGGTLDGKGGAYALTDYMLTVGKRPAYSPTGGGATQYGSTMRALEALGIVAKNGNSWNVANAEQFKYLVAQAKKARW